MSSQWLGILELGCIRSYPSENLYIIPFFYLQFPSVGWWPMLFNLSKLDLDSFFFQSDHLWPFSKVTHVQHWTLLGSFSEASAGGELKLSPFCWWQFPPNKPLDLLDFWNSNEFPFNICLFFSFSQKKGPGWRNVFDFFCQRKGGQRFSGGDHSRRGLLRLRGATGGKCRLRRWWTCAVEVMTWG